MPYSVRHLAAAHGAHACCRTEPRSASRQARIIWTSTVCRTDALFMVCSDCSLTWKLHIVHALLGAVKARLPVCLSLTL